MMLFGPRLVLALALLLPLTVTAARADGAHTTVIQVAGSGVDELDRAIVHSQTATPSGKIQHSTETVDLHGDLEGRVLYHVTSVFDFVHQTLVNRGDQVYSGTIAGSSPVLLHDDEFRFEVNLASGEEHGKVYLVDHLAGPRVECTLDVVGTGLTAEGNPTFDYTGECRFHGYHPPAPH